jgi:hypothetical protein
MCLALALDDVSSNLALVFEMAHGFVIGAEWINIRPEKKAVAGRAFKLCDPPPFVCHVQLPHSPPYPEVYYAADLRSEKALSFSAP